MVFYEPLDLNYWFVQVLAGNYQIFFLLTLLAFIIIAARMRISTEILLGVGVVYTFIFFYLTSESLALGVGFIALIIIGLIIAAIYSRVVGNR